MDNVPLELINVICKFCFYGDIFMLKSCTKNFYDIILPEELLYDNYKNNKITCSISCFSHYYNISVCCSELYLKYYRGKSYNNYEKDILFEIPNNVSFPRKSNV